MIQIFSPNSIELAERHLRLCDPEDVAFVIKHNKEMKSYNRQHRRGYSKDKELRSMATIPASVYWDPSLRHIFHNKDAREGNRLKTQFLKIFSNFATVDKL